MKKKKNSPSWEDGIDEIPFDSGVPEKHRKYLCKRCGYSELVPAWVIDALPWVMKNCFLANYLRRVVPSALEPWRTLERMEKGR